VEVDAVGRVLRVTTWRTANASNPSTERPTGNASKLLAGKYSQRRKIELNANLVICSTTKTRSSHVLAYVSAASAVGVVIENGT
jgi:hypothetical protein